MRTDGSRTILACSRGPQLAAAIRSVVPPELALVRWSAEADLESNWQCCQPWPWVIVGAGAPPPALADFARFHPVVVRWIGTRSPLPEGWHRSTGWPALESWLKRLPRRSLAGLRLAPYRGLSYRSGKPVLAPAIEALFAAHPMGLKPTPPLNRANALLNRRHLPFAVGQEKGWLRLHSQTTPISERRD